MADAVALQKFACPACGAEAHWNPSKQALICSYCGTTSPATPETKLDGTTEIREHDLAAVLRSIPDDRRGWRAEKTSVRCQSCQAISVFDPARVGQRCDFCGSASLVQHEDVKEAFRPESLLAFKLGESQVRDAVRQWYATRWFAPNKLKSRAFTDTVHGVYIPYWTFDAQAHADWTAEAGHYYYQEESFKDSDGRTKTRRVRKTRWVPASGYLDHFFDDHLVAASIGVKEHLLRGVEPFPTEDLVPYEPALLAGWVVERYQIDLVAAAERSRERMESDLRSLCARQVPGDTHRNLLVDPDFSAQTFKHILVPAWLLTYDYGTRSYQVVVNGYTGAVAGEHPYSWVKIALAILAALSLLLLLAALNSK